MKIEKEFNMQEFVKLSVAQQLELVKQYSETPQSELDEAKVPNLVELFEKMTPKNKQEAEEVYYRYMELVQDSDFGLSEEADDIYGTNAMYFKFLSQTGRGEEARREVQAAQLEVLYNKFLKTGSDEDWEAYEDAQYKWEKYEARLKQKRQEAAGVQKF